MRLRSCVPWATLTALLAACGQAAAAVTVGSTTPNAAIEEPPSGGVRTVLQTASPTGQPQYVVPSGTWAVTSVSARLMGGPSGGTAAIRFARPQGGT